MVLIMWSLQNEKKVIEDVWLHQSWRPWLPPDRSPISVYFCSPNHKHKGSSHGTDDGIVRSKMRSPVKTAKIKYTSTSSLRTSRAARTEVRGPLMGPYTQSRNREVRRQKNAGVLGGSMHTGFTKGSQRMQGAEYVLHLLRPYTSPESLERCELDLK